MVQPKSEARKYLYDLLNRHKKCVQNHLYHIFWLISYRFFLLEIIWSAWTWNIAVRVCMKCHRWRWNFIDNSSFVLTSFYLHFNIVFLLKHIQCGRWSKGEMCVWQGIICCYRRNKKEPDNENKQHVEMYKVNLPIHQLLTLTNSRTSQCAHRSVFIDKRFPSFIFLIILNCRVYPIDA